MGSPNVGWTSLKRGAIIDVIAPASKCSIEELNAGVKELESWGYQVRVPKNIFGGHWTHSHNNEVRFQHLKQALYSDSSAIWCARGGYGSLKLLPGLNKLKKPKHCKLFLGLSDITSLHMFFNQKWGWPTIHAPIISRIGRGDLPQKSIEELKAIVAGEVVKQEFKLKAVNTLAKQIGQAKQASQDEQFKSVSGILVGGNFATLMASIGTPFQWQPKNTILFLEDIGERAYRLDRLWEQLEQTGLLWQAKAVVLGDFTDTHEKDGKSFFGEFIKERAKTAKIPIYSGLPVGHGLIQRTLPLGVKATIADKKLSLITGVVKGG
jgi:muramoyltetrapeptide carboxypeptidase